MKSSYLPTFTPLTAAFLLALTTGCSAPAEPEQTAETNQWNGQTYLLDVVEEQWSEPRGIGGEIDAFVPNFLMRVEGESPDTFNVTIATAKADGTQDLCNRTKTFTATRSETGEIIGPDEFPLYIQHTEEPDLAVNGVVYDFTFKDILPNGDAMSTVGELSATMNFRHLYPLFTLLIDPTPEAVCTALQDSYGEPCAACPGNGEPFCLTVKAIELGATPTDVAIQQVDTPDPSCTPPAQ
jgi:hypothetical protein